MPTPPKVLVALTDLAKTWDKVEAEMKGDSGLPNGPREKLEKMVSTLNKPMDELEKFTKETLKSIK
jgi:hypothetical protein